MPRAAALLQCLAIAAALAAQDPAPLPPALESYLAHIAAAEGALRHGATAAVRRWLDAVPEEQRGFEWRWLDASADQSLRAWHPDRGKLTCLAPSPDGRRVAIGTGGGAILLADVATLTLQRELHGHESAVYCLSWDAAGARLASAGADRTARIWDPETGAERVAFRGHTFPVTTVRFAADGQRMLSTSYQRPKGGEIRIWRADDAGELQVLQSGYAPMTCAHWHKDGSRVVGASWDQHLHIFDLARPDQPVVTRLGPEPEYRAAQASALSPDGSLIAVGCKDDQVHLFEAWTGKPVRDLLGHAKWVESVAFAADGSLLASGSSDASVRLWDPTTGAERARLLGHRSVVRGVCFLPSGRLLSASHDGTVREWDATPALARGRRLSFAETAYHGCESPDGTTLAVGFANGDLRLYRTEDGTELRQLAGPGPWLNWVRWSGDGRSLLAAGAAGVGVWDVTSGERLHDLPTGAGVDCAAWSASGRLVAAVSRNSKARLWQLPSGEPRWELDLPATQYGIAISPDEQTVAMVGLAGAALHEAATGAVRAALEGHRGRLRAVQFAPDGASLATAGDDGTVRLWRSTDGAQLGTLPGHDNGCLCLSFSPDGTRLATGGGDDRLVLWDVASRAAALTLDAKDMYCLNWSADGDRLWVMPIARQAWCMDSVPQRAK